MFKRLSVAALFAVAMIAPASAAAPPATVETSYMHEIDYFSDSTYSVLVGEAFQSCNGTYRLFWGQETPYVRYNSEPCGW